MPLYQSSRTSFARRPMTAMDLSLVLSSGKRFSEFLSKTMDFCVTSRATALCSGVVHGSGSEIVPMTA